MHRRPSRPPIPAVLALLVGLGLVAACTSTDRQPPANPAAFSVTTVPVDETVPVTASSPAPPVEEEYPVVDPRARAYGDDPTLDQLWDQCAEGSGRACDDLYWLAPLDSEYEAFGYSCGEREEVVLCGELDEEFEVPGTTTSTVPRGR